MTWLHHTLTWLAFEILYLLFPPVKAQPANVACLLVPSWTGVNGPVRSFRVIFIQWDAWSESPNDGVPLRSREQKSCYLRRGYRLSCQSQLTILSGALFVYRRTVQMKCNLRARFYFLMQVYTSGLEDEYNI
jgi:hypothetical protein